VKSINRHSAAIDSSYSGAASPQLSWKRSPQQAVDALYYSLAGWKPKLLVFQEIRGVKDVTKVVTGNLKQ